MPFVWISSLGFASRGILRSRLRCLEGGFDLWLGDEGIVNGKNKKTIFYILIGYGPTPL
jgi:hypothetical protein